MSPLYIVATPIGNLEDITLRAIRVLKEVQIIAAEDTRKTRILLNAYDIKTKMTSYHEHNKWTKLEYILGYLEKGDVAIVSEAGTPGISDPGYELISAAIERDIPVIPVPGPSVIISALAVSGLPTDRFVYLGFLPRKPGSRRLLLESVVDEPGTIIILESPHRLQATLNDILVIVGDRKIAVVRELTKVYEEIYRGRISQAIEHFTDIKGEFTLVIEGRGKKKEMSLTDDIEKQLNRMRLSGLTAREAISRVTGETGISKRELYRAWLRQT